MNYHDTKARNAGTEPSRIPFPIRTIAWLFLFVLVFGYGLLQWQKGYKKRTVQQSQDTTSVKQIEFKRFQWNENR